MSGVHRTLWAGGVALGFFSPRNWTPGELHLWHHRHQEVGEGEEAHVPLGSQPRPHQLRGCPLPTSCKHEAIASTDAEDPNASCTVLTSRSERKQQQPGLSLTFLSRCHALNCHTLTDHQKQVSLRNASPRGCDEEEAKDMCHCPTVPTPAGTLSSAAAPLPHYHPLL